MSADNWTAQQKGMKTPLEELKLKRDLAVLDVEMTEQRIEFVNLIWEARKLILFAPPFPDFDYQSDRRQFLAATDKFIP